MKGAGATGALISSDHLYIIDLEYHNNDPGIEVHESVGNMPALTVDERERCQMDRMGNIYRSNDLRKSGRMCCVILTVVMALAGCTSPADESTAGNTAVSQEQAGGALATPTTMGSEAIQASEAPQKSISFSISSPAFKEGDVIPTQYSCDGEDQSPPLEWTGSPDGTASFVLIMDDPDAPGGTWVHWILFNIPGDVSGLQSSIPGEGIFDDSSLQGANSWGRSDYGGPCPPGGTHRYFFKLYALDSLLELADGVDFGGVEQAMRDHVLAEASLMGTFTR